MTNAADFRLNMLLHHLKSLNKLSNTDAEARNDRIRMNFIKLRPIIRRLLDLDNEDSSTNLVETEDDYEPVAVAGVATTGSDSENGIRVSRRAQFYYSSPAVSSGEQQRVIDFHRFIKGKRVKSMYGSSGKLFKLSYETNQTQNLCFIRSTRCLGSAW